MTFFTVMERIRDITKQISTASLDQHWKIMTRSCSVLPEGQVNICIFLYFCDLSLVAPYGTQATDHLPAVLCVGLLHPSSSSCAWTFCYHFSFYIFSSCSLVVLFPDVHFVSMQHSFDSFVLSSQRYFLISSTSFLVGFFIAFCNFMFNTGWPLVWKAWKCQRF